MVESEKHKRFSFSEIQGGFIRDIDKIDKKCLISAIPHQKNFNFHRGHFWNKKPQKPAANITVHKTGVY